MVKRFLVVNVSAWLWRVQFTKIPKVIVLDEPNSNLDAAGEKALADTINSLKNDGATVIVISHRPSLLANTDKIAVLNMGNLVKFAGRDEVLRELGGGRA